MPRPKKTDQKPAENPKETAKRRKDSSESSEEFEDSDDSEEFEEKIEKKLKVEGGKKEKQKGKGKKICIMGIYNQLEPQFDSVEVRTFKNLASAIEFKDELIDEFKEDFEDVTETVNKPRKLIFKGESSDGGHYEIRMKEISVEELLEGVDIKLELFGKISTKEN